MLVLIYTCPTLSCIVCGKLIYQNNWQQVNSSDRVLTNHQAVSYGIQRGVTFCSKLSVIDKWLSVIWPWFGFQGFFVTKVTWYYMSQYFSLDSRLLSSCDGTQASASALDIVPLFLIFCLNLLSFCTTLWDSDVPPSIANCLFVAKSDTSNS